MKFPWFDPMNKPEPVRANFRLLGKKASELEERIRRLEAKLEERIRRLEAKLEEPTEGQHGGSD